jgi:RND family efflux transporter MFP subunit
LEQDKIDVTRATPVAVKARRGARLWLQLLLSLIVIAAAAIVAGLYNGQANQMLAQVGISLPLLNAPTEAAPQAAQQGQGQRQGAGQGGQGQGQQQAAAGQQGARQGQGGGRPAGGFAGRAAAVVIAETVIDGTINNRLTAVGEGSAIHSVTVTSASGGTLLSVAVKPGDRVEAGAELATLDAATLQNAFDRAKLSSADADNGLARAQSLANSNSIPATQVEAAQLAADNAKLALEAAQLALDQRTIRTPIGGTIGLIQVSPGNLINAQSIVTTVEDSSEILVNFWVPERFAGQISNGMPVNAGSVALPGAVFEGVVSAVDNRIDPQSRTLQVQATLPNEAGTIRPGMSFSVTMAFAGQTFPAVDPLAIQWSNEGAYVWKVVDGKVQKGMVEIVQRNSDGVLVSGDVAPGDQVVTQGVLQLSDGAAVRLQDEGQG